jgi:hypothetical protein
VPQLRCPQAIARPLIPVVMYLLRKKFPKVQWLRQIHPVMICVGGLSWAPYNLMYMWPSVPLAAASWLWLKKRHLAFWSK